MIIGFGETETRLESKIEELFITHVQEQFAKIPATSFTEAFIKDIRKWAGKTAENSRDVAEQYREATQYPDRYSSFWCYTLADCNHIAFIISFHHINRRHAFSPDGWALLKSKRVFEIDTWEAGRDKKVEAA